MVANFSEINKFFYPFLADSGILAKENNDPVVRYFTIALVYFRVSR